MSVEVSVSVSANYRRVARELKLAARGDLQKEMAKAITTAAKPAQAAVKAAVPAYMPHRGGYAALFQKSLRLRTARRANGVTITAEAVGKAENRDVGAREKGSLRHPVFGHRRRTWSEQRIRPGFFTGPIKEHKGDIQQAIVDAVQRIADKISG